MSLLGAASEIVPSEVQEMKVQEDTVEIKHTPRSRNKNKKRIRIRMEFQHFSYTSTKAF